MCLGGMIGSSGRGPGFRALGHPCRAGEPARGRCNPSQCTREESPGRPGSCGACSVLSLAMAKPVTARGRRWLGAGRGIVGGHEHQCAFGHLPYARDGPGHACPSNGRNAGDVSTESVEMKWFTGIEVGGRTTTRVHHGQGNK